MERGLEFYVMLAAVAVGALTWLYRKGSRVWRTVRKLHRSFREICLNPKSTLDNERCRQLAVGAMYASQQGAWQNSLETGIFDTLSEILGGWWGIDSTAEARAQLDYLCEKGFRYYWPTVLEAFRLDGRERQDELLQQRMTSQEDYDKVSSQLENLRETFDELLSCGVVASKEELNGCNVSGWDAGRLSGARLLRDGLPLRRGGMALHRTRRRAGARDVWIVARTGDELYSRALALGRQTGLQFGDEDDG